MKDFDVVTGPTPPLRRPTLRMDVESDQSVETRRQLSQGSPRLPDSPVDSVVPAKAGTQNG
jgi:hypothetical protein